MTRCIVIPACLSHLRRRQAKGILRHSVIPAEAGIQRDGGSTLLITHYSSQFLAFSRHPLRITHHCLYDSVIPAKAGSSPA